MNQVSLISSEYLFILNQLQCLLKNQWDHETLSRESQWPPMDWATVLEHCDFHRLSSFMGLALEKSGLLCLLPEETKQQFHSAMIYSQYQNTLRKNQLRQIIKILHPVPVPVILIKGISLSFYAYQDSPLRLMGDIDLLIPENMLDKTDVLLTRQGFLKVPWISRSRWHYALFQKYAPSGRQPYTNQSKIQLDLHWTPVYLIQNRRTGMNWDDIWKRAIAAQEIAPRAFVMDPYDETLFLLLHTADLNAPKLYQFFDIATHCASHHITQSEMETRFSSYPRSTKQALSKILALVFDIFLPASTQPIPLTRHHRLLSKIIRGTPRLEWDGIYVLRKIPGFYEKCLLLFGFLIPNMDYYRPLPKWKACLKHWQYILSKTIRWLWNTRQLYLHN